MNRLLGLVVNILASRSGVRENQGNKDVFLRDL
jgi:hypothetical protein